MSYAKSVQNKTGTGARTNSAYNQIEGKRTQQVQLRNLASSLSRPQILINVKADETIEKAVHLGKTNTQ